MDEQQDDQILLINKGLKAHPQFDKQIKKVDIRRNKLHSISFPPDSAIEYLDVSDNLIEDINSTNGLKHLRILDFGYNLVKKIPVLDLPSLEELYLMSNDIKEVENVDFPRLIKVDMANNEIHTLKLFGCPHIQEAYFGANKINQIESLESLKNLKILDLQCNLFKEFDCNLLPESIETLLLNNNPDLSNIKNLKKLKNLKLLGIKNTKIKKSACSDDTVEIW